MPASMICELMMKKLISIQFYSAHLECLSVFGPKISCTDLVN